MYLFGGGAYTEDDTYIGISGIYIKVKFNSYISMQYIRAESTVTLLIQFIIYFIINIFTYLKVY